MRNNVLNVLFFLVIAVGFYFLWTYAEKNWLPQPPNPAEIAKKKAEAEAKELAAQEELRAFVEKSENERKLATNAVAGTAVTQVAPVLPPKPVEPPKIAARRERPTLIQLGDSTFNNQVMLTTEGGGIQQIVVPKFEEANRLGRGVPNTPLYLVPGVPRVRHKYLADAYPTPDLKPGLVPSETELAEPAYTIFHYPTPDDKTPDPKLGEMLWNKVVEELPADGDHKVVFEASLGEPYFVKFRKTYTLSPKDYHVALKIEIERLPGGVKGKGQLRYQLSGPRGLPIEGEWYTNVHRIALIGWNDRKGTPRRQYETATEVGAKRGGEPVPKGENTFKYMAVATQFFASAVAVDDTAEGNAKNPWAYVRATTELPFDKKSDKNLPYFDDVTVRAASEVLDLAPGDPPVTHSYIIYNGPAKVKLLGLMDGAKAVDLSLVNRYQDKLGLKTITDYQSPTWLGTFASTIYWTDLVIAFTNLMHWLLATLHTVIPSWALCIVALTIVVRLVLLIPSKKQTKMNLKMMEVQKKLAPQLEEMKKKYGDDFHGYNQAKMKLMMANGANPLAAMGGCLLLFAQMPIMMGLYFCLQESVFFRLEHFLWIDNLAAPDMTLWWGEHIPYLSSPDNIGGMLYLGPYFNVLPILVVLLMIGQQLAMLPPPIDEQAKQQRMMMKIMMFIMPLLFYKFAAGLALYFIVGTIWGLAERKLISKSADATSGAGPDVGLPNGQPAADAPPKPKGMLGRLKEAAQKRMEEIQRQADEQSKRMIRNDKNGPPSGPTTDGVNQPPRRDDRRDKKKKKRK
ncbi:MAG: YidC/Oxa1 family insertase periplasmic-domain containing protein [Planctomycetes bacterium]|nr:YidC/Oxa1 family insertase periplasmic-domain containing protein [Planctomycetota bacterium]